MSTTAQELSRRERFHLLLKETSGLDNVYFQAPPNNQMKYPSIVYGRDDVSTDYAGNKPYLNVKRYEVTVIDEDPDSDIPDRIAALPQSAFNRHFNADGLNHDVFTIYF